MPPPAVHSSEEPTLFFRSLLNSSDAHRFVADQLRLDKKLLLDLNSPEALQEFGLSALQVRELEPRLMLLRTSGRHPAMAKALCAAYLDFLKHCLADFQVRSRAAASTTVEQELQASDKQLTALESELLGLEPASREPASSRFADPAPPASRVESLRLKAQREVLAEQVANLASTARGNSASQVSAAIDSSVLLRYQAKADGRRKLLRTRSYRAMSASIQNWDYQLMSGPDPVAVERRWAPLVAGLLLFGTAPITLRVLARRNSLVRELQHSLKQGGPYKAPRADVDGQP